MPDNPDPDEPDEDDLVPDDEPDPDDEPAEFGFFKGSYGADDEEEDDDPDPDEPQTEISWLLPHNDEEDFAKIKVLDWDISENAWSPVQFDEFFTQKNTTALAMIAKKGDDILGYMFYEVKDSKILLKKLEVDAEYETEAVRELLYRKLIEKIKPEGPREIVVHVPADDDPTREMLERQLHFVPDEIQPTISGFYPNGKDACVLNFDVSMKSIDPPGEAAVTGAGTEIKKKPFKRELKWAEDPDTFVQMLTLLFNAKREDYAKAADLREPHLFTYETEDFTKYGEKEAPVTLLCIPTEEIKKIKEHPNGSHYPAIRIAYLLHDFGLDNNHYDTGTEHEPALNRSRKGKKVGTVALVDAEAFRDKGKEFLLQLANTKTAAEELFFDNADAYRAALENPQSDVSKLINAILDFLQLNTLEGKKIIDVAAADDNFQLAIAVRKKLRGNEKDDQNRRAGELG